MADSDRWVVKDLNADDETSITVVEDGVSIIVFDGVTPPKGYSLPAATRVRLGGIVAGNTTEIDANGVLNINANMVVVRSEVGTANGVASLDTTGKIPSSQLNPIAITNTSVVANITERLSLSGHTGDVAVQTDTSQTFILQREPTSDPLNWVELKAPLTGVTVVNGHTGAVHLTGRDLTFNVNTFEGRTGEISLQPGDILNAAPLAGYGGNIGLISVGDGLLVDSAGELSVDTTTFDNAILDLRNDIDNAQQIAQYLTQTTDSNWKAIQDNTTAINAIAISLRHLEPVKAFASDPPASPLQDDAYIVKAPATGLWVGHEREVATWDDTLKDWTFESPNAGDARWNDGDATNWTFSSTGAWVPAGRGLKGDQGIQGLKGDQGESIKPDGFVSTETDLPDTPPILTAYITDDDGTLYIYDPSSGSANARGYVEMGILRGADGQDGLNGLDGADGDEGEKGDKGDKGDAGETFKVSGVVPTSANLPAAPPPLTVLMAQNPPGNLFIYDKASAAANVTTGWVDLGQIAGPKGDKGDKGEQGADGKGLTPYTDQVWTPGSVVYTADKKYYRNNIAVAVGDPTPGVVTANQPWTDITPAGVTDLKHLTDVTLTSLDDNESLIYDSTTSKWVNGAGMATIPDYVSGQHYPTGVIVSYGGHLWRAQRPGKLVEPVKNQGTVVIFINKAGFSKAPYRATSVSSAPPTGTPSDKLAIHFEYLSDTSFKVYNVTAGAWSLIAGVSFRVWRSDAVPSLPVNNRGTIWIYGDIGTQPTPIPGQNDWTTLPFNEYMASLIDVDFVNQPQAGESLIYSSVRKIWQSGNPTFQLSEWSSSRTYNPGDTVHHQGRLWRSLSSASVNRGHEPTILQSSALAFYIKDGKSHGPIGLALVEIGDPALAPTTVYSDVNARHAVRYQSDASWSLWLWGVVSTVPIANGWTQVGQVNQKVWRHIALPTPVVGEGSSQLWIYGVPGSTGTPVAPQGYWEPIAFGDFLVSLADVDAAKAAAGDILIYNGVGRWEAKPQPVPTTSYTKTEVDTKLTAIVSGIAHGVAVIDLINDPPATPVADEFYIVNTVPTGAWVAHAGALANWNGTAWDFTAPQANEAHLVESQDAIYHWNGTAWNKIAAGSAAPPKISEIYMLGDIKQSTLTEPQFKTLLGALEEKNWALADGRDVSTSAWAAITGRTKLPDLRGSYLRMAGQNSTNVAWVGGTLNSYQEDTTRIPRDTSFTTNSSGSHSHTFQRNAGNFSGDTRYQDQTFTPINAATNGVTTTRGINSAGDHTHTITGGDTETRPKTYNVNFFIKIN